MCAGSRPARLARSEECASSSRNGISTIAASAVPAATAPRNQPTRRGPRSSANSNAAASTWKLVSGCPPKYCSATTSASPANGPARVGLRTDVVGRSSTHGSHAHTLDSGHASQTTWKSPNPATTPASSAAPTDCPSRRASRKVPKAGTQSFSAPISPSDHQNGST